jgi:hypothetical protein
MSRISLDVMSQAMRVIQALNLKQKEGLIDEIFLAQPHMFGSVRFSSCRSSVSPARKWSLPLNFSFCAFRR